MATRTGSSEPLSLPGSSANPHQLQTIVGYWIPALVVGSLISGFSTHYFSDQHTSRVIVPVLHWLFPWASSRALHLMHVGIRKIAHVTEFGVFSLTVFHGVRSGRTGWRFKWALLTLLIAAAYASLDEIHQIFVPLRHASPRDVAIDVFGALLAQVFVWWYATKKWPFAMSYADSDAKQRTT
jgi:VanZ family protein